MKWHIELDDAFAVEVEGLLSGVRIELMAHALLLESFGPELGRPRADTLKGSRHANMKELRFNAEGGAWRVAYAFDPRRRGILLVAGNKSGVSERLFYKRLIVLADRRFDAHLKRLAKRRGRA